jgi:hypothetical protein
MPATHLQAQGLARGRYNQIANFVLAQSEISISMGDKPPERYLKVVRRPPPPQEPATCGFRRSSLLAQRRWIAFVAATERHRHVGPASEPVIIHAASPWTFSAKG